MRFIWGPTYEEMLHPSKIDRETRQATTALREKDPLNWLNLYNICWRDASDQISYLVIPKELTNIDTEIVALVGRRFPTGSHKVGAAYSVTMEAQLAGQIEPGRDTLIFPSTGNYGIGGAWVGTRMGYDTLVLVPEQMSQERFRLIESYGARLIKTPGCESNIKEIYDKCNELKRNPTNHVLNQFEAWANYRFHYYCTGNTAAELVRELADKGIGKGSCSAFVSAMGSAGTIAAGDRLKQLFPETKIVGLEPEQCPTLYNNGFGDHDIQGIGDKHVTWIHNVMNMDALILIDDMDCKRLLQVMTDPVGTECLTQRYGVDESTARALSSVSGISGVCNLLGCIKAAKYYNFGSGDVIVTVLTDGSDRYGSVMEQLRADEGELTEAKAVERVHWLLHRAKPDLVEEGTVPNRQRWLNLKYFTWVEQQGKSVDELRAQASQSWWRDQQALVQVIDEELKARR